MNDIHRATAEARLIDAGWDPPPALRVAIERRENLRAAVDRLRVYRADPSEVVAAIEEGDADDIRLAIAAQATGAWLDLNCQRPSDLTDWSAKLEVAMIDAVFVEPGAVFASLAGIDSPDAAYVRGLATQAVTPNAFVAMANGQPSRNRPPTPSLNQTMIPR